MKCCLCPFAALSRPFAVLLCPFAFLLLMDWLTMPAASSSPLLINLGRKSSGVGTARQIVLQAYVGQAKARSPSSVYTLGTSEYKMDCIWLSELEGFTPFKSNYGPFLKECFANSEGYVVYDYAGLKALIPNVLTYAVATGTVPIDKAILHEYLHEMEDAVVYQDLTHAPRIGGW